MPKKIQSYDFDRFEIKDCQVYDEIDTAHEVNEVKLFLKEAVTNKTSEFTFKNIINLR